MNSSDQLSVRRQIAAMQVGQTLTLTYPGADPLDVVRVATAYGRNKNKPVRCAVMMGSVIVDRTAVWDADRLYDDIDALAVGEHHDFNLPAAQHSRVRTAASHRNRTGLVRLACTSLGGVIRVTRLPLEGVEAVTLPQRATKYGLERLDTVREIRLEIPKSEHHKVRLAASHKAKTLGWAIRCRIQDDGSMLVYRTDMPKQSPESTITDVTA